MRTMAANRQPLQASGGIAIQMFVTGLAADTKLLTQFAHGELRTPRQHHKSNNFFHRSHVLPRHNARDCNPSPRFVCHLSLRFAPSHWEALNRYTEDGRLEIDNNLCENAIRPTAIGKRNFLFIGHPDAGQRSAVIYSVLGSCRRLGINPAEYLQDVFERLPKAKTSEVKSLTPSTWIKAKQAAIASPPNSFRNQLPCHLIRHFTGRLHFIGTVCALVGV